MAIKILPPIDLLRNQLDYDSETGIFVWLVKPYKKTPSGSVAGSTYGQGYRYIGIDGIRYSAHRLAWKMTTGSDPVNNIDHINGDKSDNKIANLREATKSQNQYNQGKHADNTSGHKGVCWDKAHGKWKAQISINGKNKYIGIFTDINDAAAAYAAAAERLHGDFLNLGTKSKQQ